jgi:DNA-binding NarL/FixJ family response regulator
MDINVPRMEGAEATRIIRRESPDCNIVIVTQSDATVAREQARSVDAKGFVTKSDLIRNLLPEMGVRNGEQQQPGGNKKRTVQR